MARAPTAYKPLVMVSEPEPEELPAAPRGSESELLKDIAQAVVFYMSEECHKALLRYSVEQSRLHARVRVHDLLTEALQEWVDSKGLNVKVRAKEKPVRGRGRTATPS